MKIFKSTVFSAVCAFAACSAFAQQAPTAVAKAAEKPAAEKPAQDNEDRSYLADYAEKPASVALFDEKTKSENVVAFKEVKDDSVVFIGGGEIPISKKKPSSQKIVVKVDNNWLRIRTALGRENREEAISKMRVALSEFIIDGVETNIDFHLRLIRNENFERGEFDNGFLNRTDIMKD